MGAAILIIATAAVTALVLSKWNNLFPPADYEDCAANAAKDAKSKDALSVLLSLCDSDFKGRRRPGGGYTYYNSCPGTIEMGRTFYIKGPNPTPDERKYMEDQCLTEMAAENDAQRQAAKQEAEAVRRAAEREAEATRRAQQAAAYQAAQERAAAAAAASALRLRKSQTIPAMNVTVGSFKCSFWSLNQKCDKPGDQVDMQVEITNRSKETLSAVLVGLAAYPGKWHLPIVLR